MEVRAVRTVPADWGVHVWPEGVDWYKFQGNGGHSSGAINFDGHDLALLEIGDLQDSGAEVTGTYLRDDEDEKRPIKLGSGLRLGDCPCVDR